jgi:hypothetical protein
MTRFLLEVSASVDENTCQ